MHGLIELGVRVQPDNYAWVRREIEGMRELRGHPNIVELLDTFVCKPGTSNRDQLVSALPPPITIPISIVTFGRGPIVRLTITSDPSS